ncbi:MAG: NADH-quinone oxidoreductase subunit J [Chloroflexi bacterium]|nr:NADH-quinone oxidoreductase subunit J [Chloroflexota bacterium]
MVDSLFAPIVAACIVAGVSALMVVSAQGAIRAVVALLAHSLSIAALYALLAAGLVAVGQLLIYSGAIVVLFLFVVALLPPGGRQVGSALPRLLAGIGCGFVLLAALATAVWPDLSIGIPLAAAGPGTLGSVAGVGHQLFDYNRLLIPFELTAPLLLVAIIGAVALWRRQGAPS